MIRHIGTIIILFLFFLALMPITIQGANTPYTIYGRVTSDGIGVNGLHVTIYDSNTHESLSYLDYETLTTWTGVNGEGYYSANIGNMATAWARGDVIYVNLTYQGTAKSEQFTIPATGYIHEQDITFATGTGAGGQFGEGENQWRSVPGLWEIINWLRHINLEDLIVVLALALVVAGLLVAVFSRKRRHVTPIRGFLRKRK